ncbi:UvrD-helicase domain-containing protein [Massilia norwichensis]|uniref:DNA 3'-5' helicase II n=1 Tax=Massilia norwichensis TaxID=1442366 RepID=A0ABT2ACV2_9BURK|nr:UvrD-helicase domain-containing protein [Massilia norwichensis]MCS0591958.1 UvrD-helicase domain-containing protein [Massilia norwichensis]
MPNTFIFAGAGTGKTERIVDESIRLVHESKRVLVLTYTQNNQKEVLERFLVKHRGIHDDFRVKGLLTFYLEEIIRPYQREFFSKRIEGFILNDADPHKKNGYNIPGRKEILTNGKYNPLYYLTSCQTQAHSALLAKFAYTIIKKTNNAPIQRLEAIYDSLYFDECQDMVGWDFEVLSLIAKSKKISITCVGDFRQTIYETAITSKKPGTSNEKVAHLKKLKFAQEEMNESRRSVPEICNYASKLHTQEDYPPLKSNVVPPEEYRDHQGVFVVKESDARTYLTLYQPVILRQSVAAGTKYNDLGLRCITFGKSKGLGFPRTAIIPTQAHLQFLQDNNRAFSQGKTDESRNKFYVALTRAKYSVALIVPNKIAPNCHVPTWAPIET